MPAEKSLPGWYPDLLASVSRRVEQSRRLAIVAANHHLVQLYWAVGREILDRQHEEVWGAKVIERLAADLRHEFPQTRGFSPRNLNYMRAFAGAWSEEMILQASSAQLSWSHFVALIDKVHDAVAMQWYVDRAASEGWSTRTLIHEIESQLFERSGGR